MKEPNKLTKLSKDWLNKEKHLMKETKIQCKIPKNIKY